MSLTLVPPIGACILCGHSGEWHRTEGGACTAELHDPELGSWIRCDCMGWVG